MSASKKKKKNKNKANKSKKNNNVVQNTAQENVKNKNEKKPQETNEVENKNEVLKENNEKEQEIVKNEIEHENAVKKDNEPEKEESISEKNSKLIEEKKEDITQSKEIEKPANKLTAEKDNKLIKVEEKPDYVKDMLKKKKRKTIIFIFIVVIIIVLLTCSTVFALLNVNNTNIITGIKVKNIDLSNLSIEDAKSKLNGILEDELLEEVKLKYNNEYEITLAPSQIEFKYDVDSAINKAYSIGRTGNILENNYEILLTAFLGKEEKIEYSYNEEFLNAFIDDLSSKIPGVVVEPTYYIEDNNLIINQGKDGISVKKEELKEKILNSILDRKYEEINNENYNLEIEIPTQETKTSEINIDKIYSEVKKDPQDAYFELEPYQIYPDSDGIDFDVESARELLKEYKEEYTIPLKITKATKTIDDLGTEAFPYLISSFSTKYDASNRNRSTNLEIAAKKINGKVLMPGEVFSFNKVVGKRTVEEGYRDAKIYADGGVVDGLAGGICQISSTLYNAVLLANLEIVERRNHSYVTSYVVAGRDATVVYGAIDFQFKNSRSYPIKIEASVKNGVAEFKIHGMQEENEYEIKIIPVTTASIPYSTQYVQDPTLMPGQQVVTQAGHAGYKVTTYIEKRLNGAVVSKEVLSNDTYSPMKAIIRTN